MIVKRPSYVKREERHLRRKRVKEDKIKDFNKLEFTFKGKNSSVSQTSQTPVHLPRVGPLASVHVSLHTRFLTDTFVLTDKF